MAKIKIWHVVRKDKVDPSGNMEIIATGLKTRPDAIAAMNFYARNNFVNSDRLSIASSELNIVLEL